MASSESAIAQPGETDSENQLSSLIYDLSNDAQAIMANMLKMIADINQNSAVIEEEIEKCKGSAIERKIGLDEEKNHFQKAAYAVLDMLNRD